jgi:hypothetical protein
VLSTEFKTCTEQLGLALYTSGSRSAFFRGVPQSVHIVSVHCADVGSDRFLSSHFLVMNTYRALSQSTQQH